MSCNNMDIAAENQQLSDRETDLASTKNIEEVSSEQIPVSVGDSDCYAAALASVGVENLEEISAEQLDSVIVLDGEADLSEAYPPAELHAENDNTTCASSFSEQDRLMLYVLEDRSIKLFDTAQQKNYYLTSRQLEDENIDVNNLTGDNLQRVIQMAMLPTESPPDKKRRMETDYQCLQKESFMDASRLEPSTSEYAFPTKCAFPAERCSTSLKVGMNVQVRRNGRLLPAVIRYCRQGGCYKVQYADGRFEWVFEDELRVTNGYKYKNYSEMGMEKCTSQMAGTNIFNNDKRAEKKVTQIPGITVTPTDNRLVVKEPNFRCAVCDKEVYQKEPQYIVIRIPACDLCAEEKVILLDGEKKECAVQVDLSSNDKAQNVKTPSKNDVCDARMWANQPA